MKAYLVRVNTKDSEKIINSSEAVESVIKQAQNKTSHILNLDDSWCAIHFVMTGEYPVPKDEAQRRGISWNDDSLENVILGGSPTPYTTSWGVARYLNPQEVARMTEQLVSLTVDKFKEWYDPEELMEEQMPPGNWDESDEARDWLVNYFKKLVEFYRTAAGVGDGILIYMV
jgi:hypothetical protein